MRGIRARAARVVTMLLVAGLAATGLAQAAEAAAGTNALARGERLDAGQQIVSENGLLKLVMQGDGNLVLYAPGGQPRWHTNTYGNPGAWMQFNSDGNLVVYGPGAVPLWNSFADGGAKGGTVLQVRNDGNLVQLNDAGYASWQTGTRYYPSVMSVPGTLLPGQSLQSPNGRFTLTMQPDGNLVLYGSDDEWLWHTNTFRQPVTKLSVQGDGNLVLYTAAGYAWASGTHGTPSSGGRFQVQDDGNVVLYTSALRPVWNSFAATNIIKRNSLDNPHPADALDQYAGESGWTARAEWIAARFVEAFPAYRCDGQAARWWGDERSDHRTGNGIDCTHRAGTDDKATGDAASAWLRSNAGALKIKYVIWWGVRYWPDGRSGAFDGHYDHIHISVL